MNLGSIDYELRFDDCSNPDAMVEQLGDEGDACVVYRSKNLIGLIVQPYWIA